LRNCGCGLKKKLRLPTSVYMTIVHVIYVVYVYCSPMKFTCIKVLSLLVGKGGLFVIYEYISRTTIYMNMNR
jgi:hypothetical protein